MVLLNFLLPLFFIAFSLSEVARLQYQNGIAFHLVDFASTLLVIVWLFNRRKKDFFLKSSMFLFLAASMTSLLFSLNNYRMDQVLLGSLYLIRWALFALIYFVFSDFGKRFRKTIVKWMFICGILTILIGFAQFFFYPSLRNLYYLGWDEHLYRMFSSFLDPNFAGIFFVLFFIFLLIMKQDMIKGNKFILLYYLTLTLSFISIILTYSRGALLMLTISIFTYSLLIRKYKIFLVFLGLILLIFIILSPRFYIENTNLLRLASLNQRLQTSVQALNIYSKNSIFGVGFNNLRYAREKYGYHDTSRFGVSHSGAGVDNSFIFVLVTTGVPGILTYFFLLYKMFKLGFERIKKNKFAMILIVSLVGLTANSFFINSLFYSFVMIWVFLLAGLTESN